MSAAGLQPIKWTKSQFVDLYDQGFLELGERYELIEGDILRRMSPVGILHGTILLKLGGALSAQVSDDFEVSSAASVELSDTSMLEPDVFVFRANETLGQSRFANGKQVVLVAEISDSTLAADRGIKRKIYAEAEIAEYWIVNVDSRVIEVYRQPSDSEYLETMIVQETESVSPHFDPSITVSVKKLFPKA